jgi:hypothetical protein
MIRATFLELVQAATSIADITEAQKYNSMTIFSGCALHTDRIISTEAEFRYMVNYQAMQFNGTWDNAELENLAYIARRVDILGGVA